MKLASVFVLYGIFFTITKSDIKQEDKNLENQDVEPEYGSYSFAQDSLICSEEDTQILSECASEILAKLDTCKPDDLACECCALQSLNRVCFDACHTSLSSSYFSVIMKDCESMSDVDACDVLVKKSSGKKYIKTKKVLVEEQEPKAIVKSLFNSRIKNSNDEDGFFDNKKDFGFQVSNVLDIKNSSLENTTLQDKNISKNSINEKSGSQNLYFPFVNLVIAVFIILIASI